jgi:hypothetical protein
MSSNVQFEEDGFSKSYSQAQPIHSASSYGMNQSGYSTGEVKGMAGWLMRHHLAKSPQGAQFYLIGLVIINLIITFVALTYLL